jgi:sigma-B regulation protein RsbU (phosphoserine phosphatase)
MSQLVSATHQGPADPSGVRTRLLDRRRRLSALPPATPTDRVEELLDQVDAALARLEDGHWGECARCQGRIEPELLAADATASVCLDCFSESERRALEHDLTLASRVQASLLPPQHFRLRGWSGHYLYRPHATVSGDYVDVMGWGGPAGGSVVLVGDVSGKGVAAALLMSHLHAAFRSLSSNATDIVSVVEEVNRLLCAATSSNSFATLVAARLQDDGSVELCSAGHTPALLATSGGVNEVPANGMPLGIFPGAEFGSNRLVLRPGDRLVLYTDGLTESADPSGVELGVEGAASALAAATRDGPRGVVAALDAAAARHRNDLPPSDDMTVMALAWSPS